MIRDQFVQERKYVSFVLPNLVRIGDDNQLNIIRIRLIIEIAIPLSVADNKAESK